MLDGGWINNTPASRRGWTARPALMPPTGIHPTLPMPIGSPECRFVRETHAVTAEPCPASATLVRQASKWHSAPMAFDHPGLFDWLEGATEDELNALPFGVIAMATDATVEHYNATEGKLAGLTPDRVIGRHFFNAVAPCMNNVMVAQRFAVEAEMDDTIDYVLTLRMSPRKVRLRLLRRPTARCMYLIVERRI